MTWTGTNPAKWAEETIRKLAAVPQVIADEMANTMTQYTVSGGLTPLDTGNLSRSVTLSFVPINRDPPGYNSPKRQNFEATARQLRPDTPFYISYKAAYAHRVNYGFVGTDSLGRTYNQSGRAFLEGYAAQFPAVVARAVTRLNNGGWRY